jgi:hypothetical protein
MVFFGFMYSPPGTSLGFRRFALADDGGRSIAAGATTQVISNFEKEHWAKN